MPSMLERFRARFPRAPTPQEEEMLELIDEQMATIEAQRAHIKRLDERIAKLEREAGGLRELI